MSTAVTQLNLAGPQTVAFGGVLPGSSGPDITVNPTFGPPGINFAGGIQINAPADATVHATISGDTSVFQVRDLTVLDFELQPVDEGELPHGHKGPIPKVKVLAIQTQVGGNGSVAIKKGQKLLVRVHYDSPAGDAAKNAELNVVGDTWPAAQAPVSLFTAQVVSTLGIDALTLFQGQTAKIPLLIRSVVGPATNVAFETSRTQLHTGISMEPTVIHLGRGEAKSVFLTLHAAPDAPLGENTVFLAQSDFRLSSVLVPVRIVPVPEVVLADRARKKILDKYSAMNGPNSSLGLPVDPSLPLGHDGTTFLMDFRGGKIKVADAADATAVVETNPAVTVSFVALECQIRQESTDEMYGAISILVPSIRIAGLASHETFKFPGDSDGTLDMGPDNLRIVQSNKEMYTGPPTDLLVSCNLIEHDSGDAAEVKEAIRQGVEKVAQALGAVTGVDAEHLASQQDFLGSVSEFFLDALSNLLGAKDDQYNPGAFIINWQELKSGNLDRRTLHRTDDPKSVAYTHSLVLNGRDDGGDVGQYAFYFNVT